MPERRARWRQSPLDADPPPADFHTRRRHFRTELVRRAPAPGAAPPLTPTDDLTVVPYASGDLALTAWLRMPRATPPVPVLVYLHAAYALDRAALEPLAPFVDAGAAVFAPTFRGEHGNPGDHELFFGELDDARAAVDAVAADPRFDAARIFVLGHSGGGLLSAMLALDPTLPAVDTASVNGVYDERLFDHVKRIPFGDRPEERTLRVFAPHLEQLARPHLACVGDQDLLARDVPSLEARAAAAGVPLALRRVPGDHFGAVPAAVGAFLTRVRERLRR